MECLSAKQISADCWGPHGTLLTLTGLQHPASPCIAAPGTDGLQALFQLWEPCATSTAFSITAHTPASPSLQPRKRLHPNAEETPCLWLKGMPTPQGTTSHWGEQGQGNPKLPILVLSPPWTHISESTPFERTTASPGSPGRLWPLYPVTLKNEAPWERPHQTKTTDPQEAHLHSRLSTLRHTAQPTWWPERELRAPEGGVSTGYLLGQRIHSQPLASSHLTGLPVLCPAVASCLSGTQEANIVGI